MECEAYSFKIWEILSKTINELKIHKGHAQFKLHTYNVMYHIPPHTIEKEWIQTIMTVVSEIKRDIICRRLKRLQNPNLNNILYDTNRIISHIIITVNRVISLKKFQKKNTGTYQKIMGSLTSQIT